MCFRENILHMYYPPYLKKKNPILKVHTSRKIAYIKMYKDSKINPSIFKSS